jgi:hypothetical protein
MSGQNATVGLKFKCCSMFFNITLKNPVSIPINEKSTSLLNLLNETNYKIQNVK